MTAIDQIAQQMPTVIVGEVGNISVDMRPKLDSDELLTGTPTVEELDEDGEPTVSGDLTIDGKAVNTAAETIQGDTVPIGKAILARVSDFNVTNQPYYLRVLCATDKQQTRGTYIKIPVASKPTK